MTTYALRPYQEKALDDLRAAIRTGRKRLILCAPTGSGKTVTIASMIEKAVAKGNQVLFLAHRRELVHQCSEKLRAYGVPHGITMAGDKRTDHAAPVQVASIATLHARLRRSAMTPPPADLVVVDECHHATATTWKGVLDRYPDSIVVGLSATPSRKNGKPLGDLFDVIVPSAGYKDLIRDGFLVPTRVWAPSMPDLKGVPVSAGDYNEKQLGKRMDKPALVGDVVDTWLKRAEGRPTLCYAVTISHSQHLCAQFAEKGISAEHIDGTMDVMDRDQVLDRFREGDCNVLCNCMVLTEGVDIPHASCAILARPTKSLVLYRQMAGRIQRPAPLKADAMILDHSGAALEHGLPDEDLEWDLKERAKKDKDAEAQARKPARCPKCGYVCKRGTVTCPQCGAALAKPKTGRLIRQRPGELREISGRVQISNGQKQKVWVKAIMIARARGAPMKVASGIFKGTVGTWPDKAGVRPASSWRDAEIPAADWWDRHKHEFTS